MEKLLPQNIEAECGVLGSLIIDPESMPTLGGILQSGDFYREAHQTLFEAMENLAARNQPADFITLCDTLDLAGKLDQIGGASYITSLIGLVPTSGNLDYYANIVRRCADYRRLIHAAGQIAALGYSQAEDAFPKAEKLIFNLSQRAIRTAFEAIDGPVQRVINSLHTIYHSGARAITGVASGFWELDKVTGGWQKSDLIILAARPGMGKTSMALAFVMYAALTKKLNIGIFSLEMSKEQLVQRLMAMRTGKNTKVFRTATEMADDDWEKIVLAGDAIGDSHIWIDDTGRMSLADMRSKARKLHAEQKLDLIVVDYLQLLRAHINGKRMENPVQEVTEISGELKDMAKELGIPVIALSQLSRDLEKRPVTLSDGRPGRIPQLSDLRQSGSIEQDADIVLFIYRDDAYSIDPQNPDGLSEYPGRTLIIVAKDRHGPTGEAEGFFYGPTTCFFNDREEAERAYGRLSEGYYPIQEIVALAESTPVVATSKKTDWRQAMVWEKEPEEREDGDEI